MKTSSVRHSSVPSVPVVDAASALLSAALDLLYPVCDSYLDDWASACAHIRELSARLRRQGRAAEASAERLRLLALLVAGLAVPQWSATERRHLFSRVRTVLTDAPVDATTVRLALYLYGETFDAALLPLLRHGLTLPPDTPLRTEERALLLDYTADTPIRSPLEGVPMP